MRPANQMTTKPEESITVTDLMLNAIAFANDVVSGKISPAASSAAARHYTNIARFLDLRCRFGNTEIVLKKNE